MLIELKPEIVHHLRQLTPKQLNPQVIEIVTTNVPPLSFFELRGNRIYFKDEVDLFRSSLRSDGIHLIRAKKLKL